MPVFAIFTNKPPVPPVGFGLWAVGNNSYGGLMQGTSGNTTHESSPVQVGALTTWTNVSGGQFFTLGIHDGTLWSCGYNNYGSLGLGTQGIAASVSSPTQVGALTDWESVSGSFGHVGAVKTDNTLWTWGRNTVGRLGLGDQGTATYRSSPVQVGSLTNWSKIYTGEAFMAALKTDGTIWAWGEAGFGQLGNSSTTDVSSPVQAGSETDWSQLTVTDEACAAIKTDGTLWTWGSNQDGELGLGGGVSRSSPEQVGSGTDWESVAGGKSHMLAIKTDGSLWAWGYNLQGELGHGDFGNTYNSPVQIGALTDWSSVSTYQQSVAIKDDGSLWSWGVGNQGMTAQGNEDDYSSPVQVGALTDWQGAVATISNSLFLR